MPVKMGILVWFMEAKMAILIDTTKVLEVDYKFSHCIGSGRIDLALREDYLKSLAQVQKDIGFHYIRAHGIFSKDLGIYREFKQDGITKVIYNFTYLDQVFDNFLKLNIKPFLELGFMPNELASGSETVFWWNGNVTPPADWSKWQKLIQNTLEHLIERYGITEVSRWPIEVWNEPNLVNFWKSADQDAYFKLYQITSQAIKEVDSRLQVGGPVISGGSDYWLKDFLKFCKREQMPLDFISRHSYTSGPSKYNGLLCDQDIAPIESMLKDFRMGREYLNQFYGKQLPVYISEFNSSYTPDNPVHDSAFNAAYLAPILSQASELVDSYSYWTFCDMFEEKGVPASFLHGGFGLMTQRQIKKPTYYLYQFFAQLGNKEVFKNDKMHVGWGKDGSLIIIAWNANNQNQNIDTVFNLSNPGTKLFYQQSTVDKHAGNVNYAWHKMGSPRFPTTAQITSLRELSLPKQECGELSLINGKFKLKLELTPHEVTMIRISPVSEDAQTY